MGQNDITHFPIFLNFYHLVRRICHNEVEIRGSENNQQLRGMTVNFLSVKFRNVFMDIV